MQKEVYFYVLVDIGVFSYILKFVFTRLSVTNSQFPQRGYNSSTSVWVQLTALGIFFLCLAGVYWFLGGDLKSMMK